MGIILFWRHDIETLWATSGGVLNARLSVVLKNILNHERPVPTLRSDPGMPSFICAYLIIDPFFNGITVVTNALIIAMGSYFVSME